MRAVERCRAGRVLLVSPDLPAPLDRGFRIRVHHLAVELSRHGYGVVLLARAPGDPDADGALRGAGVEVRTIRVGAVRLSRLRRAAELARGGSAGWFERRNVELRRAVERLVVEESFDAVQIEIPELASVRLPSRTRLVLDAHNVWSELIARRIPYQRSAFRRLYGRLEHARYRRAEVVAWRSSARCLVTSSREAAIVEAGAGVPAVIPNGVDTHWYRPAPVAPPAAPRLLFIGLLRYGPNADAVAHMIRDIMPLIWRDRPDATLQVVGEGASPALAAMASERVAFAGRVADVRPLLDSASAIVVPLRIGSGTRLKILEAMAMARPIVTTPMGVDGIEAYDGEHLLIAPDPGAFAAAVLRVLGDAAYGAALGERARRLAETQYAWSAIGDRLDRTYRELLAEARS
jgi:polysaccharide biosynthesis protein PslH